MTPVAPTAVPPPTVPVLNAAQAAEWDRASIDGGVPSRVLMESAGRAAAVVLGRAYGDRLPAGVLVAAGHGNNGGDGWVLARALRALGVPVWVTDADRDRTEDCAANRDLALRSGVERFGLDAAWPTAGLAVDALLGTGAAGAPRGAVKRLAEGVAGLGIPIVALDGPTGLDLSSGETHGPVRADLTVTFGGFRRGHVLARDWCGRVVAVEMGFLPPSSTWPHLVLDPVVTALIPPLGSDLHKGDRGRVLLIGGQAGMAGAVRHAARGAFAAGAGLVRVATDPASAAALQEGLPDAMTATCRLGPDLDDTVTDGLAWADAVVIGPGLGRGTDRTAFVRAVLEVASIRATPVILDADALHTGPAIVRHGTAPRIATPHAGEFRAAFPDAAAGLETDRFAAAAAAAAHEGGGRATVLLKGVPTLVATPDEPTAVVAAGNPGLATGGSGDVLAGFIATLAAQGLPPHAAAVCGAQLLGRSAETAARTGSVRTMRPDDVLAAVPMVWRALRDRPDVTPPVAATLEPVEGR